ncbi:hypothetical protein EDD11_009059 [Mortierella claussenii]|nr:hypothetical protein EDD11_009059 [Mortierella claussenii]
MISLPRSPVVKLFMGLLVIFGLMTFGFRYQSLDSEYWRSSFARKQQYRFGVDGPRSFKVPKSLYLTHDVAIPQDTPPWTQEDTDLLDTTIGFNLKTKLLKQEYNKFDDLTGHPERISFSELSRAQRLYKALWQHVYPIFEQLQGSDREREKTLVELAKTRPEIDFLLRLEKRLYPWLHFGRLSSLTLYKSYKGRGIVFCAGNGQFEFVVTSIQAIRNRLRSQVPIQVFHMGEYDLSKERQAYLRNMAQDIEVVDVTNVLDNDYMQLGGWAIKPFAMLASKFEEVMFVDADAYFLQDPVVLFDDPGYKATGALFFYDRTLFPGGSTGADWLQSATPVLSTFPKISRMFRKTSAHEQESGVVLINKHTRFLGMLAVCKSNGKWERDLVSYTVFHGDKETFWTAFELIQEPYAFMRSYGGVIGELRPDNAKFVCGAQLHLDAHGRPLWWNGGLYRNKNAGVTRYLRFDYWMAGGGQQQHREWITNSEEGMKEVLRELGLKNKEQLKVEPVDPEWDFQESCLAGGRVQRLSDREKKLANGFVGIDRIAREDGEKMKEGQAPDPKVHDWSKA